MAKGSQFWGNASGKLGEQVLYRSGGEQRARTYVAKIKNPKSLAQMENRILMNNVVSMFRGLRNVIKWAFPDRAANQSAFNAFVKANKNVVKYGISKADLEQNIYIPIGLQISKGTFAIPTELAEAEIVDGGDTSSAPTYALAWGSVFGNGYAIDGLFEDDAMTKGSQITPAELYTLLTSNGNQYNLPSTFKVTIVGGAYSDEFASEAVGFRLSYVQYTCSADPTKNSVTQWGDTSNIPYLKLKVGEVEDYERTEVDGVSRPSGTLKNLYFGSAYDAMDEIPSIAIGVIVSFTGEGKQQVSNTRVYGSSASLELVKDWQPKGFVYQQVLDNYGYSQESTLATT